MAQDLDNLKALWVFQNLAPNAFWKYESSITKYKIGVFGNSSKVYQKLVDASINRTIKGKPFEVVRFRKVKDITYTHILYVEENSNNELREIYNKMELNTLLITDQNPNLEYSMLNLRDLQIGQKKFEINKQNADAAGIKFNKNILREGGTEVDIKQLIKETEEKLEEEKRKLEIQRQEFAKQTRELLAVQKESGKRKTEIEKQKELNEKQKEAIANQQREIAEQQRHLAAVQANLLEQASQLEKNTSFLEEQETKMKESQEEVAVRSKEIEKQQKEIEEIKKQSKAKDESINERNLIIRFQRMVLFVFIALVGVIAVLAFYIWRGYKIKQKINDELRFKNIAINRQKEEIQNQHKQTDLLNKELERLSIVAAKTDNAVTIMDQDGNFEWVNVGYTRLYGYTLQLLTHEVDDNIINVSTHPDISKILQRCKETKITEVFESENNTRNGGKIWIQTSLTPILDVEGNVSKLITIETDITQIKEAEKEIRNAHSKILEQTRKLEATNKELEKLSLVASETENAISIMDAAGNYTWINDGFSRMYGYSFNQLITEYSKNIISADTSKEIVQLIKKSIEEQVSTNFESLQYTRDKKEIWVQTTLTPITDNDGNVKSIIAISSDISKLKQAEQEIRQNSEELMAQKEELIQVKDRIELQNQNIQASISYAKTIQTAILPPDNDISKAYETFVIYRPKDIVSGDFYWSTSLPANDKRKELSFYAAVDCTGHGVPGAFMSMIGSSLLNTIVNEKKVIQPSQILELMNQEIKTILRQEETDNNDGMDICLCSLEHIQNGTVKTVFAGAKRPLYYFSNEEGCLKQLKGTRKAIGGTKAKRNQEVFTDQEIVLERGDLLYLSTDGLIDQPSPERVRFGSQRLVSILENVATLPLQNQKNKIQEEVDNFQGNEEQRDDITFLGVKI